MCSVPNVRNDIDAVLRSTWPGVTWERRADVIGARVAGDYVRSIAESLHAQEFRLGTIVASERDDTLEVRYCFYARQGWVRFAAAVDPLERTLPSITPVVIAADWFEREIEDLFSIHFTEHPRLGDFVLHDEQWAENVGLMRPHVSADEDVPEERRDWRPKRVLEEEGAFVMPVGPVYSGEAESALFLLETVGEDVVRAIPRLFYKYRAIEKRAEGRNIDDVLLLAERCAGTSAFGNGWAYCRAVERALGVAVPERGERLRTFFAELERMRHHMTSIREICASTSLTVAESHALWLEEQLLRICGETAGHRYLFGVLAVGGLLRDYADSALQRGLDRTGALFEQIESLKDALENSSSFLDRIERVGIVSQSSARAFELVGPFARASGVAADLRTILPYGPYPDLQFQVPIEQEGDGYARLRLLFAEMRQSLGIMRQLGDRLPGGDIRVGVNARNGCGLGWTEAPRGASVQWVELSDGGTILRYRLTPPSFRNWHGFHVATEQFAFQDFPIILATLDLSVAENDR
ncbi:MAG TPA: NADH-quinone oxidoreductase subunit C [Candidatus Baltobacteraceae bacterium]|nr:NADH-quinone oxidoreductase subunit C [Candidatus Baltobacteraceae bacterium]